MLFLTDISADFDKTAEGTIPTGATAEQLKTHFTVSGNAANSITVPIDNFTLELPTTGLVKGNNEVTISYRDFSTTHNVPVVGITPAAPAAPTESETPTSSSITLTTIAGAEYSRDNGVTWQDSPIFTGLEANTEYTFLARIKATDTAHASPASVVLTIKTKAVLSGGAIAGIVIGSVLVASVLALLALFLFRKNKSIGFKDYYVGLGGTCAATVKGWGGKIKGLFSKENAEKHTGTLPEDSEADQDSAEEPDDEDAEPKN